MEAKGWWSFMLQQGGWETLVGMGEGGSGIREEDGDIPSMSNLLLLYGVEFWGN